MARSRLAPETFGSASISAKSCWAARPTALTSAIGANEAATAGPRVIVRGTFVISLTQGTNWSRSAPAEANVRTSDALYVMAASWSGVTISASRPDPREMVLATSVVPERTAAIACISSF